MKVLMVGPEPQGKGGMSTVIKNFQKYDQEMTDVSIEYLDSWAEKHRLRMALRSVIQFFFMTRKSNYDIVHFQVAQDGSLYRKMVMSWLTPKRTRQIFHMHSSHFDKFYQTRKTFLKEKISKRLDKVNLIVALSPEWQEFYQTITETKVVVINNAVYLPQENNYNLEAKTIMSFGRLGQRKGTYDILSVAEAVYLHNPELKFLLYGDGEVERVKKLIEEKQLQNIEVGTWLDNPTSVFSNCGLHLLPSYHEGVPMSMLETMAYGIPNLTTTVGGIPQVITNDWNGYLVEPGETFTMANDILTFFSNTEKRETMSNHAREKIAAGYSFSTYFSTWKTVYEELVE